MPLSLKLLKNITVSLCLLSQLAFTVNKEIATDHPNHINSRTSVTENDQIHPLLEKIKDSNSFFYDLNYANIPRKEKELEVIKFFKKYPEKKISAKGKSALHAAAENDWANLAKLLLNEKMDANISDKEKRTPLHSCMSIKVAELLINKGANVNAQDSEGITPLYMASNEGILALVKLYVSKGAKNVMSNDKVLPIHRACKNGRFEVVKFFLENGADVNTKNRYGASLLHLALNCSNEAESKKIFKLLLTKGIKVDEPNSSGFTPVMLAAQCDLDIIKILVSKGADPKRISNNGGGALHNNTAVSDIVTVKYYLQKGLDINALDGIKRTILHLACSHYSKDCNEVVKFLIAQKIKINAQTNVGTTALMEAVRTKNKLKTIETLLQNGANISIKNKSGKTALDIVVESQNKEYEKLLKKHQK